jgi:hypothetical protein
MYAPVGSQKKQRRELVFPASAVGMEMSCDWPERTQAGRRTGIENTSAETNDFALNRDAVCRTDGIHNHPFVTLTCRLADE